MPARRRDALRWHPQPRDPIPEETARVARAAFPKGNPYMRMRDELGVFYEDDAFAALFPARGQPAEFPWRLVLTLVLQYAENLSDRQAADAEIQVIGPVPPDTGWQAQVEDAFDVSCFAIDWDRQQATCPAGTVSRRWSADQKDNRGKEIITIQFARKDCQECPSRSRCTTSRAGRRLSIRPREQHLALQDARRFQRTPAFKKRYDARAGVEGTLSQELRVCDLRHARYIGPATTHLQHVLTAAALNLVRVAHWLEDPQLATTRRSPFLQLLPRAA